MAKLMTAYVIVHDHPVDAGAAGPQIVVRPDEAAAYPAQARNDDSLVPVIAGERLDFVEQTDDWPACGRNNVSPADSAGITVHYTYRGRTPLRYFIPGLASLNMTDSTVMPLNASK